MPTGVSLLVAMPLPDVSSAGVLSAAASFVGVLDPDAWLLLANGFWLTLAFGGGFEPAAEFHNDFALQAKPQIRL